MHGFRYSTHGIGDEEEDRLDFDASPPTVVAHPPLSAYLSVVKDCFDGSVPHVSGQSLRGRAYSILGLCDYLRQFPGASDMKRQPELTAESLLQQYESSRTRSSPRRRSRKAAGTSPPLSAPRPELVPREAPAGR